MKVYLAKSNRSNPIEYMEARHVIFSSGAELKEHLGGSYTHDDLLSCDTLVVLPEEAKSPTDLGRGLYEQIQVALEAEIPVYVIVESASTTPKVIRISERDLRLTNKNDYINWARLTQVPLKTTLLKGILPDKIEIIL